MLHLAVWEYHFGKVGKGYHIHHKDHNRKNNDISNLVRFTAFEHLSYHGKLHPPSKEHLDRVRPLTKAWHASEEGREWHRKNSKNAWKKKKKYTKQCQFCGREYETYFPKVSKFCHNNCKAANLRTRRRGSGIKSKIPQYPTSI